ncbi:MAG: DUF308 domain-containing protein [Rickettsiales bacterium]|jgi:uncharacterized membrane protein HdeD (DUF308 family)|nr:DUF308 domain-containing protein [Rickettsiales bacterium]
MVKKLKTNPFGKAFTKHANSLITEGVLLLILSVLMLLSPTTTLFFLVTTLGVAFTVFGIYYFTKSLLSRDPGRSKFLDIIFSLMPLGLGIILILFPQLSFTVFVTLIAAIFLVRSIYFFIMSIDMINADSFVGILGIFVSLVSLLLAGVIIIYPITAAYAITLYVAISLLFYAISDIVIGYRIKKIKNRV